MKKNITLLIVLFSLFLLANSALAIKVTLPNPLCPGGYNADGTPKEPDECIDSFKKFLDIVTNLVFNLIGGLAVLMFIWAGILFVTSAGNEGRLASAKKAFWWAVIGVAIAVSGKGLITVVNEVIGPPP